jgi:hypothetical protein
MNAFEIIILIALYLFAFSYMANCFGIFVKRNTWVTASLLLFFAATIGIFSFPLVLGQDIWNKLNKEEQQ